jgi:hypothetical protein
MADSGDASTMTTTVKVAADGKMALPEILRKSKRFKPGTRFRVTEAGEGLLFTPMHPPTKEELAAVIESAGGSGSPQTLNNRKQVESTIERVRARAREAQARR